jgi:hypothetical protein
MGIDGIGKKGPAATPGPTTATAPKHSAGFDEPAAQVKPASPVPSAQSPLDQLRGGQIGIERYLDLKVVEATAHLASMPPVALQSVQSALRERLASDPALIELVRAATGVPPPPLEE